jgi:hypothetical protein
MPTQETIGNLCDLHSHELGNLERQYKLLGSPAELLAQIAEPLSGTRLELKSHGNSEWRLGSAQKCAAFIFAVLYEIQRR